MIAHCLFEQSGTFKNQFKKLGIDAYDYDILNNFGETDYQIDLFGQIEGGIKVSQAYLTTYQKMISLWHSSPVLGLKINVCFYSEGKMQG
jgi:hypothetical protein